MWEYKKPGVDLDKAYEQLKLYKDELQTPPLLVVSDFTSFRIHTNFNNAPRKVRSFSIESLAEPVIFNQLRNVFWNPETLRPERTVEKISRSTAAKLAESAHLAIQRNEAERVANRRHSPKCGALSRPLRTHEEISFAVDPFALARDVVARVLESTGETISPASISRLRSQLLKPKTSDMENGHL